MVVGCVVGWVVDAVEGASLRCKGLILFRSRVQKGTDTPATIPAFIVCSGGFSAAKLLQVVSFVRSGAGDHKGRLTQDRALKALRGERIGLLVVVCGFRVVLCLVQLHRKPQDC